MQHPLRALAARAPRGFDERLITGEDVDLGLRARAAGASLVAAPEAVVHHAIEPLTTRERIRENEKWEHLVLLVKKHPELRDDMPLRVFWKPEHLHAALALAALAGARRRPWMLLGLLPYYRTERLRFGPSPRGRLRALRLMPVFWLVELAEIRTFARGSLRHRTLVL